MAKRYLLRCYYVLVVSIVCATLAILSLRFILANLPKESIEQQLTHWVGLPVTISQAKISWSGYKPVINFSDVTIGQDGKNKHPVTVHKLLLSINLWQSLYYHKIQPKRLLLNDASLYMHLSPDDKLNLANSSNVFNKTKSENIKSFLQWFLRQKEANIRRVHIDVEYNQQHFPIELASVHFVSMDDKRSINIKARSINNIDSQLEYTGQFVGEHIESLSGHWFLALKQLPLSFLDHHIEVGPVKLMDGLLTAKFWGYFANGQLRNIHTDTKINKLFVKSVSTGKEATLDKLSMTATLNHGDKSLQIAVSSHLNVSSKSFSDDLKVNFNDDGLKLALSRLDLSRLKAMINFIGLPLPEQLKQVDGTLENTELYLKEKQLVLAKTDFSQAELSVADTKIKNLSGTFEFSPEAKILNLLSPNMSIAVGESKPFVFDKFIAKLSLQASSDKLSHILIEKLALQKEDNQLTAQAELIPNALWFRSQLTSNIHLDFKNANTLRPLLGMFESKGKALKWLSESIKSLHTLKGDVETKGVINNLFKKGSSSFLNAKLQLKKLNLKYHPKWPQIDNIDAHLEIQNNKLNGLAISFMVGSQQAHNIIFSIDDLFASNNYLYLRGEEGLELAEVRRYLSLSPIKYKIARLDDINVDNKLKVSLHLEVPLDKENHHNRLQGRVLLFDHNVAINNPQPLVLKKTKGFIEFDEHGVTTGNVDGMLAHGPVKIALKGQGDVDRELRLDVQGKSALPVHHGSLSLLTELFSGSVNYHLNLSLKPNDTSDIALSHIKTQLISKLKLPFNNINQLLESSRFTLHSTGVKHRLMFKTGKEASGTIRFDATNSSFEVLSGQLRFGVSKNQVDTTDRNVVTVDVAMLSLDEWLQLLESFPQSMKKTSLEVKLPVIKARAQEVVFKGFLFKQVSIAAEEDKGQWNVAISGPDIAGRLILNKNANSWNITGHLKHLELSKSATSPEPPPKLTYQQLPTFHVRIDDLRVNRKQLGSLEIESHDTKNDYIIDKVDLASDIHSLHLTGGSSGEKNKYSKISAHIKSIDLLQTLRSLSIHPVISSKRANVALSFSWKGGLQDFSMQRIAGVTTIDFRNGRITELNKEAESQLGLGKLISILSLQTLPRRLMLDFSDLAYKGFSYDVLKATFNVDKGVFSTKKLSIEGPVAYVEMVGDIDVLNQRYAMKLHVSPHITASLPVVATIAGGPIAGIFTWIASKILNQGMQKVTGYSYSLQGPWNKPLLEQTRMRKHAL